ncbi:hypothetical protein D3C80_2127180 [compost metagenome]
MLPLNIDDIKKNVLNAKNKFLRHSPLNITTTPDNKNNKNNEVNKTPNSATISIIRL